MSAKGKHRKREAREETTPEAKCVFCLRVERNVLKWGKMFKYKDTYVHHYCMLLSSGLVQNGKDSEGIQGFLVSDINKEVERGKKLKCSYCRTNGATIGCSVKKCKAMFHLPCGLESKAMPQFFGAYDSHCVKHRPLQTWHKTDQKQDECPTCYGHLEFDEGVDVLATPCCKKLVHRVCVQKQALSAGAHHFKCPLCNNKDDFVGEMKKFGVYVPVQDASWERENNAYSSLYERHSSCNSHRCQCPGGRKHREASDDWLLLICETCGSNGSHWKCLERSTDWTRIGEYNCDDCRDALEKRNLRRTLTDSQDNSTNDSFQIDNEIIEIFSDDDQSDRFDYKVGIFAPLSHSTANRANEQMPKRQRIGRQVEVKDIGIQCCLVLPEDLIDIDPIDSLRPHTFRHSIISLDDIDHRSDHEVIDIDDSDDDCLLLN